jgi:hypothetical protein
MWLKITYEKTIHFVLRCIDRGRSHLFRLGEPARVGQIRKGSGDN